MDPNAFSRLLYYLRSIPTLFLKIRHPLQILRIFLGKPRAEEIVTLRNSLRFKVRSAMDVWVAKETCLDRDYERDFVTIEDGWSVVDVGASFGDFCISVAARCPASTVLAFEPSPDSVRLLEENIALNGVRNVRVFPAAVASRDARSWFRLSGLPHARSFSPAAGASSADPSMTEVEFVSLETILEEHVPAIDFLKLDCEGAEYDILMRSPPHLLDKIRFIALEYHDGVIDQSHSDLERFLHAHGFAVRRRRNRARRDIGFLFGRKT